MRETSIPGREEADASHQTPRRMLFVYPEFPPTFLGLQYALPLLGKKAHLPPLGLLTIAALTPAPYEVRLVDLNCEPLSEEILEWAEVVCFSVMLTQQKDFQRVAARCRQAGKLVVVGGPYASAEPEEAEAYVDVMVFGEGEITWPQFLADLERGDPRPRYEACEKPVMDATPVPRFDLLQLDHYASMAVQYSRGCPFDCEFCDVIVLFGRKPRVKSPSQFLAELQALYDLGYRGFVNVVDDNLIGNRKQVRELLRELIAWNASHGNPFSYSTQLTIDLAQDEELLRLVVESGFRGALIGLETPDASSLRETAKTQNLREPMLDSVLRLQSSGFLPSAGFIVGFDHDGPDIFVRQVEFIRGAAIPFALAGLLVAVPGTRLHDRMQKEGRLLHAALCEGDRFVTTNIDTVLRRDELLEGYCYLLRTLYEPQEYFGRCRTALSRLPRRTRAQGGLPNWRRGSARKLLSVVRQIPEFTRGLPPDYRRAAFGFVKDVLARHVTHIGRALTFVVLGAHFYRFTFEHALPALERELGRPVLKRARQ